MTLEAGELHERDHEGFLSEVHSFEFWFQSVEGYLHGHPHGVSPSTPFPELAPDRRAALVATLSTYCVGELTALEGASGMIGFAPNRATKIFLATQVADEARHLEVLLHRLAELGVEDAEAGFEARANRHLMAFRERLLAYVVEKDWLAALFAQNVILEAMEFAAFQTHLRTADARTAELLGGVLKDERRHIGFGENALGRHLASHPDDRRRLREVRQSLEPLVFATFEDAALQVGLPAAERPEIARLYLDSVARLGLGT
ncbi:MAG: long-chain fatty aldehyde decarbonylase [Deltaproteobacteria bacterium]|nr:long-chain fatty aldehyde decarbonylase [Deltaproteobacteria bacterium]